jgi:hypothetical protein
MSKRAEAERDVEYLQKVGTLGRAMETAILTDFLGGLEPNNESRRMAHNAAIAALGVALDSGWRPTR